MRILFVIVLLFLLPYLGHTQIFESIPSPQQKLSEETSNEQELEQSNLDDLDRLDEEDEMTEKIRPRDEMSEVLEGDKLVITNYGFDKETLQLKVNSKGYIIPPGMSPIYLKNLSVGAAKKLLQEKIGLQYRHQKNDFEITFL